MAEQYRKGGTYTKDPRTGLTTVSYGPKAGGTYATGAEVQAKKTEEEDWTGFAKALGLSPMQFSGLGGGAARSKYRSQFDAWKAKGKGADLGTLMGQ